MSAQDEHAPLPRSLEALKAKLQQVQVRSGALIMPAAPETDAALRAELAEIKLTLARLEVQLRNHDEGPSWLIRVLENRYVQYALVAAGAALTQWQVTK